MKKKTQKRKATTRQRKSRTVPVFVHIKVVGIGGGGGNAVTRMSEDFIKGVEFVAINTDTQDLEYCEAKQKINIGRSLTKGMGTGMNPDLGRQAAEENRSDIAEALQNTDLVFLTAGMGGGTGTGATPVVAEIAREMGILTVAVVTKPFAFEGSQRIRIAEEGIAKLKDKVDSLIIIPNDRVFSIIGNDTSITKAFIKIDEILRNTVKGISEIVSIPGIVNVDFADVKMIMGGGGLAFVGVGQAAGNDRAIKAATQAINSPLLEFSIDGAKGVLFGVSGGADLKMAEINEAAKLVTENVDSGAKIIFGAYHDRKVKQGQLKIILIATGFNGLVSRERETFSLFSPLREEPLMKSDAKKPEKEALEEKTSEEKPEIGKAAKADEEIWDIPTFLRKKRK
ncbi:MAG TPA: cell division protein FtsZ [Candidatus Colwellbacteria bacterium]|nr:cell division protein FtsZ [Candidatus Colwellbacteria bacterium]